MRCWIVRKIYKWKRVAIVVEMGIDNTNPDTGKLMFSIDNPLKVGDMIVVISQAKQPDGEYGTTYSVLNFEKYRPPTPARPHIPQSQSTIMTGVQASAS